MLVLVRAAIYRERLVSALHHPHCSSTSFVPPPPPSPPPPPLPHPPPLLLPFPPPPRFFVFFTVGFWNKKNYGNVWNIIGGSSLGIRLTTMHLVMQKKNEIGGSRPHAKKKCQKKWTFFFVFCFSWGARPPQFHFFFMTRCIVVSRIPKDDKNVYNSNWGKLG